MSWADLAIKLPGLGQTNFDTLSTKALVLTKMGRDAEAQTIMQTAVHHPTATSFRISISTAGNCSPRRRIRRPWKSSS